MMFLVTSCALPKRYIVVQTMGESEDGHRCFHIESLNGRDIDIVKLPSSFSEGQIKWVRIKRY